VKISRVVLGALLYSAVVFRAGFILGIARVMLLIFSIMPWLVARVANVART